jgi:hypothetical protein
MADAATTEAEFWHVQLPTGEVRYWSLEELDEAFQRDEVDAKTYVLKEGETAWQRLGELLGLDEVAAAPVTVAVAPYSIATPFSVRPSEAPGALSIRPVVSDVIDMEDDDVLVASMKPKRKNMAFIGGGAAAALVLVIVALTHGSAGAETQVAAAAPAPPPAAVDDSNADVTAAAGTPRVLSDDVKRRVLEGDKERATKAAARAAENAKYHNTASFMRAPKSGAVFHKGGNQFDPLNAGN